MKPFQNSGWIGVEWAVDYGSATNRYFAFRKLLRLPSKPALAHIAITADARYLLWVNGRLVGRGPARCFPSRQSYDEYDLAPFLQTGANWIAALVHQFGKSNGQYIHHNRTGLLLEGAARFRSGRSLPLRTDLTWQVREADWYRSTNARLSLSFGFQERYEASREPTNWRAPANPHAALKDQRWKAPFYMGPPGCPPWTAFEPRGLKPMSETLVRPAGISWAATGRNAPTLSTVENLIHLWDDEKRQPLPRLPVVNDGGWIKLSPKSGGFMALAFDFGWNHAAYARVEVRGARGGEIVDNFYAAGFARGKEPELCRGFSGTQEGVADRFILKQGTSTWESFTVRGYRQHIVVARANTPLWLRVTARRTHHAVEPRGKFECSDETLNRIWETSDRTLRAGMLDAFVDNNCREQTQWLHDGCVAALGAWATYGDTSLWRRGLRQWAQGAFPDGSLNSIAPSAPSFMSICDYNFIWAHSLWQYYQLTGDLDLLRRCLPTLRKLFLELVVSNMTAERLFIPPEGHWMFLDWSRLDKRPYSLTLNLLLLRGWRAAERIARARHDASFAAVCGTWNSAMTRAIVRRFWSAKHNAWKDHLDPGQGVAKKLGRRLPGSTNDPWLWEPDKPRFTCVQHSNALAALLQLGCVSQQRGAAAFVAESLKPRQTNTNMLSHLWTDKIFGALFESGCDRVAVQALRDWHGRWLKRGATTWDESWNASERSHSQTAGASVNWLLTFYVLGIRPTKPGLAEVRFDPRPGDITWARGVVPSPLGDVRVEWKRRSNGAIDGNVETPVKMKLLSAPSIGYGTSSLR